MITFSKAFDNALYQNSLHMKLIAIFVGILSSQLPATLSSCQPILASLLSSPTKSDEERVRGETDDAILMLDSLLVLLHLTLNYLCVKYMFMTAPTQADYQHAECYSLEEER